MKAQPININAPEERAISLAARLVEAGAVVVFPSDTSYGLATNPLRREAVIRLNKIKRSPDDKGISCIFRDISQIEEYAFVGNSQRRILERNLPGPFTFLLEARPANKLPWDIIGVRIPDNSVTRALAYELGIPYTATSANLHKQSPAYSLEEVSLQFEGQIYQPDLILDGGKLPQYPVSAVVDIRGSKPEIVREGVMRLRR